MLLALVCLVLSPSQVAHATTTITHDSSGSNDCGSCSTLSWPMTVGSGANGILLVGVSLEGSSCHPFPICTANTVTYGASSLTLIGRNFEENAVSEIWFLQPPTAGTATVTVTVNGTADFMVAGSVSFFGVSGFHDFTPGQGQSTNPSVTVNANMGDVVFDCVVTFTGEGHYGSLVWNNPQSPQWEIGLGGEVSQFDGGGSYQPADPTVTNGWHTTTPRKHSGLGRRGACTEPSECSADSGISAWITATRNLPDRRLRSDSTQHHAEELGKRSFCWLFPEYSRVDFAIRDRVANGLVAGGCHFGDSPSCVGV